MQVSAAVGVLLHQQPNTYNHKLRKLNSQFEFMLSNLVGEHQQGPGAWPLITWEEIVTYLV